MNIIYPDGNPKICCIYKVTNLLNDKVYIGQTTNYQKRSSDYRNAHKKKHKHLIYQSIFEEGTENFKMEVLKECSPDELAFYEQHYINQYDSANPKKGYNIYSNINSNANNKMSRKRKSISHIGLKEPSSVKCKKSNQIFAIKDDMFIFCDSAKLFGDYVGKSKDYIKNCIRQPSSIDGYYLYYADKKKRDEIRYKVLHKKSIRNKTYIELLNILDKYDTEGLETIYLNFEVYQLTYDNYEKFGTAKLEELCTDHFAG